MTRIVVGVDGSDEAKAALGWALGEAQVHDATLHVIHAYAPPPTPYAVSSAEEAERIYGGPKAAADELLSGLAQEFDLEGAEVTAVETLSPAQELVTHSEGAAMVVTGARGLGSVRSLLLGSVSQEVVQSAQCPVVIVRQR